jgi:hypothetical protein
MCKSFLNNNNNLVENARDTRASEGKEVKKLYFNKHFFILYVYDHLKIYARILKAKEFIWAKHRAR